MDEGHGSERANRLCGLLPASEEVPLFGLSCRCVTLEALIRMKRAAGRPKYFEALAELEALRDERERP